MTSKGTGSPRGDDYRLRPVQDQRARDERAKRGDLVAAVGDVRAADDGLAAASERVARLREAIGLSHAAVQPVTSNATSLTLLRVERYRTRLRGQLELALIDELHARELRDGKATSADHARDRLALARAARRVVEAHFARWRDDQRKLAERRED